MKSGHGDPPFFLGGGGAVLVGGGWAREIGTICCQIGVFMGERCKCLVQKGSFLAISHYVSMNVAHALYFIASLFSQCEVAENGHLGPKNDPFG